jgi:predicted nucleic acid-binding protein
VTRFLVDSSVMVASVCTWHELHDPAHAELTRRLEYGEEMVVAGHSIAEAYSVLTRLPAPYRLSADEAGRLVSANFVDRAEIAVLTADGYRDLLREALARNAVGGQLYDLIIALCAQTAEAQTLLTFNERHFRRLVDPPVRVVVPGEQPL